MFEHVKLDTPIEDLTTSQVDGMRFYKTPNDLLLPSITTVLGAKEKPWLEDWRKMLGAKKAKSETERCAERGTAVHLMCERYLNNVDIEDVLKDQERTNIKMFNQMKLAIFKRVNNIHAQEVALYSETIGTAGRTDLIAEYDGVLSVVDFKTSNGNKDEKMIQDYFLQSTAYAIMYYQMYGIPIEDIVIVMGVEKGMMPLVFKEKIDNFVAPLLQRVDEFYKKKGQQILEANS